MRLPSKDEILDLAKKMYMEDCVRHGVQPLTPEEDELREMGYFERARLAFMRRDGYGFMAERFKADEVNWARKVLEENGYTVIPTEQYERIMEKLAVLGLEENLRLEEVFMAENRLRMIRDKVWMEELKQIVEKLSDFSLKYFITVGFEKPVSSAISSRVKPCLLNILILWMSVGVGLTPFMWGVIGVFIFRCPMSFSGFTRLRTVGGVGIAVFGM